MKVKLLFIVIVTLLLSNCTIQKRVHLPGWHIEWKKNYKNTPSEKVEIADLEPDSEKQPHKGEIIEEVLSSRGETVSYDSDPAVMSPFYESVDSGPKSLVSQFSHDKKVSTKVKERTNTLLVNHQPAKGSRERGVNGGAVFIAVMLAVLLGFVALGFVILAPYLAPSTLSWLGVLFGVVVLFFGILFGLARKSAMKQDAANDNKKDVSETLEDSEKIEETEFSNLSDIKEEKPVKNKRKERIAIGVIFISILIMILVFQ